MNVTFSPAARLDLIDIAIFISQDNPARAASFVDELEGKCLRLGRDAEIGTLRPDLGAGVRMLVHGSYLIFYRAHGDSVRIERVMHGARDIGDDYFSLTM